ncbi:two-component system, NarL family, sensor histidine kinase DesK [Curtobacterium sp. 314Chir4.1]|uniref:sensor histidine kinase n=1 Tax=Curtobacterium sp. 314Chir4.1 TaxID=1279028 RepID=UPI000BC58559|nr:sensor histidine kinase [Curtobacterium sp. 314Chir4.1]SOC88807.1 two-component system, NarL family, sensor histidine kinase DesK [Curtobacterium sp. 314Chir4.1]
MSEATRTAEARGAENAPRASRPTRPAPRSFPWAVPPGASDEDIRIGRRRWYAGAVFALLWQVLEIIAVWSDGRSLRAHVVSTIALAVVYAAYLFAPELMWRRSLRGRVVVLAGVALLAGLLLFVVGPLAVWTWLLVAALSGFVAERFWVAGVVVLAILGAQFLVAASTGWDTAVNSGILFAPVITVSVGASMLFFGRQREAEQRLGVAQDEITRLAVVEERARFSRDLHDVLGHSLTVVAMKSELAARLVDVDPARAKTEMQDVERLSREALQGLRHAVSGYREADLDAELVSARAALEAAEIDAALPHDGDAAADDVRSLFAWVLREGVTNVVRHAAASRVRVTLTRTALTIEDDGTGLLDPDAASATPGNGLRGLRERADAVGARLTTGTSDLGGFRLRVERERR